MGDPVAGSGIHWISPTARNQTVSVYKKQIGQLSTHIPIVRNNHCTAHNMTTLF
jgi:hypothetical protein